MNARRVYAALRRIAVERGRVPLLTLAPSIWTRIAFRNAMGAWPHLRVPRTFNEKVTWQILHDRDPLRTLCGDKLGMRQYATELGLGALLPKLYATWDDAAQVDLGAMPERFFLKCSHGCGYNIPCLDKSSLDVDEARRRLAEWMRIDYAMEAGEPHYAAMPRRILCEEYLDDRGLPSPVDYKAYVFHGRVHNFAVGTGRAPGGEATWDAYDPSWQRKLPYYQGSMESGRQIPPPASLTTMLSAAAILGAPFPFVRIDFYDLAGRPVLGELTFTPSAGRDPRLTETAERELGEALQLPI